MYLTTLISLLFGLIFQVVSIAEQPTVISDQTIVDAMQKGVDFIVKTQNSNGSWGSATRTKSLNIYAPVPGAHHAFRTAITAMCISALIESEMADDPQSPAGKSLLRGRKFLLEELPKVRRANDDAIYNVWTHAYGMEALGDLYRRTQSASEKLKIAQSIQEQVKRLERFEAIDGGWGYYNFGLATARPSGSSISFTTATVLVAYKDVQDIPGVEMSQRIIDRAIASINRQRKPDLSYIYGEYLKYRPMYSINRPGGSLGRSQACNYALRIWGDESIRDEDIDGWLTRLDKRNGWLDIGRKRPVPHETWFGVSGYFYYYGHYYAAKSTEILPVETARPHKQSLARLMLSKQEKDGSWWDYPFYNYHQSYGTAYALMTLTRCRQ